jgi:hypothetical protein
MGKKLDLLSFQLACHPFRILELVKSIKPDSKSRRRFCMALGALARFAGVEVDLKRFKGNYSLSKTKRRQLPEDAVIQEWRSRFTNPAWQWVYGMLAVYGLRPHEVFHLDLERLASGGDKGSRGIAV